MYILLWKPAYGILISYGCFTNKCIYNMSNIKCKVESKKKIVNISYIN